MIIDGDLKEYETYCPYCKRVLTASNIEEVEDGYHDSYIFVHTNGVVHDEEYEFAEVV